MLNDLTDPIRSDFNSRFPNVMVDANTLGNDAGWTAFCMGEADVLQTTRAAAENDNALCYANEVDYETVALGSEALVLAVPESADWIECLTAEEMPAATLWSDINPDWPETEILLIQPVATDQQGEVYLDKDAADFLTNNLIGDLTMPFRTDGANVRNFSSADYRLVGVGNTDNGITYACRRRKPWPMGRIRLRSR